MNITKLQIVKTDIVNGVVLSVEFEATPGQTPKEAYDQAIEKIDSILPVPEEADESDSKSGAFDISTLSKSELKILDSINSSNTLPTIEDDSNKGVNIINQDNAVDHFLSAGLIYKIGDETEMKFQLTDIGGTVYKLAIEAGLYKDIQ